MSNKDIPTFKNEEEEFDFWSSHDVTDYLDMSSAKRISLPNLKPSTKTISLRLPKSLLDDIKSLANERDVPYQSYMKVMLSDSVHHIKNPGNRPDA